MLQMNVLSYCRELLPSLCNKKIYSIKKDLPKSSETDKIVIRWQIKWTTAKVSKVVDDSMNFQANSLITFLKKLLTNWLRKWYYIEVVM